MTDFGLAIDSRGRAFFARGPRWVTHRTVTAWSVWLVVGINAAVIVWLWLRGGGISSVHDFGGLCTSTGRVTGLLGAYTALIQVLLLARLPFLEHITGFDRLTVWHRRNGKLTLYLVLAHTALITIGYASMDKLSIPSEASTLLSSYPGMVAATVGTALMVVIVISSLVIARSRLRYEVWYLVHITAYAAIALAWVHQIPTGNELAVNAPASAYWESLYVATLVLLVGFRVVQPIMRVFRYGMRVASISVEGPNVVSLRIKGRHLDRLHARPGQFFLWRFLTRGRWWESHPFSLSDVPDDRSLRITVKDLGDFTSHVGAIQPGARVIAEGPFGGFTSGARQRDRVAFMAGGIGITPIRSLLEEMKGDLTLVYRVLREEDLIFRHELEVLARDRGITLHYVVGDHLAPGGEHLLSPGHLHELVPDIIQREVYVCGPPGMATFIEHNVRQAGVPRQYIHIERFAL